MSRVRPFRWATELLKSLADGAHFLEPGDVDGHAALVVYDDQELTGVKNLLGGFPLFGLDGNHPAIKQAFPSVVRRVFCFRRKYDGFAHEKNSFRGTIALGFDIRTLLFISSSEASSGVSKMRMPAFPLPGLLMTG